MAKLVLSEAQEEQLKSMVQDKKDNREIRDFFKEEYRINLPAWKLNYLRSKAGKPDKRAKKQRKALGGGTAVASDDIDVKELIVLLQQIDGGMKKLLEHFRGTLKQLRGELLKSRGQVYRMVKGAGIPVTAEEEAMSEAPAEAGE